MASLPPDQQVPQPPVPGPHDTGASPESPEIEVLRSSLPQTPFRAVLFDFDGTLSLLRRNWQDVMIPMMVEQLAATGTRETPEELYTHVEEFVMRLNGRQTIYQMMQLADEVRARGGTPLEPLAYKHQYHERLWAQVEGRVAAVAQGKVPCDEMMVPGSRALLQSLTDRGLTLYLASGTDLKYVREEASVLQIEPFFGARLYGALDDYRRFSKAMIIEQIVREMGIPGEQVLGFGDGFVEIEEIKRIGGWAVGVASNEETRRGINDWKRNRLLRAGADMIIGDYRPLERLLGLLFPR